MKRAQYDSTLTEAQKMDLKELKREVTEGRHRTAQRKKIRELGRPKRAASSFLLFMNDPKVQLPRDPKQTYREYQVVMAAKWATLSAEEKAKYVTKSQARIEEYRFVILNYINHSFKDGIY